MTETSTNTGSKKQVALIMGIPVIVVLFSSLLFFLAKENVINFGTVNHGTLIRPPVQMGDLSPERNDGSRFLFDLPDSKWAYMVVGGQQCQGACERMLYLTRQTRIALGKKTDRVERIYLALDGPIAPSLRDFLETEHEDVTVLYAEGSEFVAAMRDMESNPRDRQSFYVVDPLGWIMMNYRAEDVGQDGLTALGKSILEDMKRLLK